MFYGKQKLKYTDLKVLCCVCVCVFGTRLLVVGISIWWIAVLAGVLEAELQ